MVYLGPCQPLSTMPIGQTWHVTKQGSIVNVHAKTCLSAVGNGAPPPPPPPMDYYNMTSTVETHWPAVPASGWLLAVDPAAKTIAINSAENAFFGVILC